MSNLVDSEAFRGSDDELEEKLDEYDMNANGNITEGTSKARRFEDSSEDDEEEDEDEEAARAVCLLLYPVATTVIRRPLIPPCYYHRSARDLLLMKMKRSKSVFGGVARRRSGGGKNVSGRMNISMRKILSSLASFNRISNVISAA